MTPCTRPGRPASHLADKFGDRQVVITGCLIYTDGILLMFWGASSPPDFVTHWLPRGGVRWRGAGLVWPILAVRPA